MQQENPVASARQPCNRSESDIDGNLTLGDRLLPSFRGRPRAGVDESQDGAAPPQLWRPFASIWRSRGYVCLAFVFWFLGNTIPRPFSEVRADDLTWYQRLISEAFNNFSVISYTVFLAGLCYAVISDVIDYSWTSKIRNEMQTSARFLGGIIENSVAHFSVGLRHLTYEGVKLYIEDNRLEARDRRSLVVSSMRSYLGDHDTSDDNLVDFTMLGLIDGFAHEEGQVVRNMVTTIVLRGPERHGQLKWEESRSFRVFCAAGRGIHRIHIEGSVQINSGELESSLNEFIYTLNFDGVEEFNFAKWWGENRKKLLQGRHMQIEADDVSVSFDGTWLRFSFFRNCQIRQRESLVRVYEHSSISVEDRAYSLAVRYPTNDFQANFSIEGMEGWIVKTPAIPAYLYSNRDRQIVSTSNPHLRAAHVHFRGWVMPGLAMVVEWTPPQRAG